jgi:N-sulfoglucosamine sulfohydrolase
MPVIARMLVFACALLSQVAFAQVAQRPNILLLVAEDMSTRVGAFSDRVAVTPNLDALAEQGVRYTRTFTTSGVCAPSRAALMLGMHQIATGSQHMRTSSYPGGAYYAVPPAGVKAFPELLRASGYFTYTDNKLDYQFSRAFAHTGPNTIWDLQGATAGDWDKRARGQPFFGMINFPVTHESGIFTPLGTMPHSVTHFAVQLMRWWALDAPVPEVVLPENIDVPPYYPDLPEVRSDMARHYNNIAYMDGQVGAILQQLEDAGLADSTIVIFTSDHGDGLPRAKRELFDSGIQVPMIIRWPAAYRPQGVEPGAIDERLISFVDLAPTILSLASVFIPRHMHGTDFTDEDAPPREYVYAARDRIDDQVDRQRAVRDKRYKYLRSWYPWHPGGADLDFRDNIEMVRRLRARYDVGVMDPVHAQWYEPPGEERLFDLETDPDEIKNLADKPEYEAVLRRMRSQMNAWLAEVGDNSEDDEATMVARFEPEGERQVTPAPDVVVKGKVVEATAAVWGHSMEYRIDGGPWQLYTYSIDITRDSKVEIRAVRYGWEESEIVSIP